jgi:hypothetical protein
MSVRDAMIAAIQAIHGVDLEYDDGVDADALLAAVAPLIRRAALEEAAGVVRSVALQWRGQVNTAATNSQRTTFVDRETGAMTALAAIRALDT